MRIIAAGSDASDAPGAYLDAGADVGAAWRSAGCAERARQPAQWRRRICPTPSSPPGLPDVSHRGTRRARTLGRPRRRCRNHRSRPCPRGISSTSRNTGAYGGARTAISASTWPPRAAARSAATGARSPSGATSICNARPPTWPRRCCICKRHYRPDHIWFADDIFGFKADWVREFAAALADGRGRRALHHPVARRPREHAHGRGAA